MCVNKYFIREQSLGTEMASFLTVSEGNDVWIPRKASRKKFVRFGFGLHPPHNTVQTSIMLKNLKKLLRWGTSGIDDAEQRKSQVQASR